MSKKTPKYTNHNGYFMPYGFPADNFTESLSYEPEDKDLIIATYPKNGTTLTQHMVYLLLNDGIPIQKDEKLDQVFPHLEEVGSQFVKDNAIRKSDYRLIKTHLPYNMVNNNNPNAKYIFVIRNSKDCVVSFYHHTRGFPQHYDFEDGDFDIYFHLFLNGEVDFGSYFHMVKSWFERRQDDNILCITYEDMITNKEQTIVQIAKFLSNETYDLVEKVTCNNGELMKKIIHHSSVGEMKKEPLRWCSERKAKFTPFIRNGQTGCWNELLTKEQVEILDKKMRETFQPDEIKELGDKY